VHSRLFHLPDPLPGMDQVEDIDRDRAGDRLGERDGNAQRVSEADEKLSAMLVGYNVGGFDRDDERSPPKLELVLEYRHTHHSPPNSYPTSCAAIARSCSCSCSSTSTFSPFSYSYNRHIQCPLPASASDGTGRDDLRPS